LALFAETEIFIFVFMEIMVRIQPFRSAVRKQASWRDQLILVVLFGGFSIFGTYVGIELSSGAISNVRDFGPMMAGLVAGPRVGLGAGLVGGIHRIFLGGFTGISCGLATVLAGLICGQIYNLRKGKLPGVFPGMLIAGVIEGLHGGLTLLIARPFAEALEVIKTAIPAMTVANSLGIAIGILLTTDHSERKAPT
jgi:sigma-B regulation protein RsbU (phosphoserine phosphatase)